MGVLTIFWFTINVLVALLESFHNGLHNPAHQTDVTHCLAVSVYQTKLDCRQRL